jgi:iron complex transport system ATP-binding protein
MARLELQDVHFTFDGERDVLAGISLALEPGVTTAVVGPNGAGKTTLLRVAGGLLLPSRGRVLLDDAPIRGLARRAAARLLAAVPAEQEAVFPFTVRETVTLGRHPWRGTFAALNETDRGRVDEALSDTALQPLADRALPALSSGERQRAAIARCLAQDAEVYLLDEPTAHLDLGQRLKMLRLFRRHARDQGRAVLAVLHDLNLAAQVADRVVLLVDGRIAADGPPAEVFTADRIEAAFETPVHVVPHPDHGAPVIVPADEGAAP